MQTENPNNNNERDLILELMGATEIKKVSTNPVQEWNFANDDKTKIISETTPTTTSTPTPGTTETKPTTSANGKPVLSEKKRKQDAEASAAGVEFLTIKAAEIAICFKFARNFTDDEKDAINNDLLYREPHELTPEQSKLLKRWHVTEKKREKKLKKLEVGEKARERMVAAFEAVSEETGETFLTPKSRLVVSIIENIFDAALEVFID